MTSAPVKGVGALMNFVGGKNLTQTGGTNQTNSFGDVMSKTKSGGADVTGQKPAPVKGQSEAAQNVNHSRRDKVKTTQTAGESSKVEAADEYEAAVKETGEEIISDVAKELGVSEEEVVKAMEELGLSVYSLLNPADLTQLVLTISGEDTSALLTDEGLFSKLQNILQMAKGAGEGLMEKLEVSPEEMQGILEKLQSMEEQKAFGTDDMSGQQNASPAGTDEAAEQTAKVTVEVKTAGETVKLVTDENGNVDKTIGTVSQEQEVKAAGSADDHRQGGESKGKSGENGHTGNPLIDAMVQDKAQIQTQEAVPVEQTGTFFNSQTQDIMDQIMDYMKIQLKPGMDQLEMQLHPASLGTVHIQISSKGGEITAQFQVQNETVKAAIESQVAELKESLRDQGVKVEAVQVTVENHGFESNLWQGQGREQNPASGGRQKTPRRINLNELDALFEEQASEEELLSARMMEVNGNTVDYTA